MKETTFSDFWPIEHEAFQRQFGESGCIKRVWQGPVRVSSFEDNKSPVWLSDSVCLEAFLVFWLASQGVG